MKKAMKECEIHRDYIAHCHRWSFIQKWLEQQQKYKATRILDVGCGKDLPLLKVICSARMATALPSYTGVDINKLELDRTQYSEKRRLQPVLHSETDILSIPETDANLIVCLEMLEHVPQAYAEDTIRHLHKISPDDATFILSTPVFNGKAARNHINEMTRELLMDMLSEARWKITENYGTFASKPDIYPNLSEEDKLVYDRLTKYYCNHHMSTIFAPLYPEYSRNNLWVCTK